MRWKVAVRMSEGRQGGSNRGNFGWKLTNYDNIYLTRKSKPTHKGLLCIEMPVIFMIFLHVALDRQLLQPLTIFQVNSAEGCIANARIDS